MGSEVVVCLDSLVNSNLVSIIDYSGDIPAIKIVFVKSQKSK